MWLKIETHTINKPEVFAMAANLATTRAEVVGHLVTVWAWFDQNTEDGCVQSEHGTAIVDGMTMPFFADAMIQVGWLNATQSMLCLPNFGKHNGSTAKKRANGQARQSRFRNASSVTREDKKKEEKKETTKRVQTPFQKVVELWNDSNDPKVEKLTTQRKAAIRQLCKEYTLEQIEAVFKQVPTIPFLIGQNERGWVATFDYVIRPDKFLKIFEGGWNNASTVADMADFNEWNK